MSATLLTVLFQSFFFKKKICRYSVHGLRMCMWFGLILYIYSPSHFSASQTQEWVLCFIWIFLKLAGVSLFCLKVYKRLKIILNIIFSFFFSTCELSHLALQFYFYLYSGCSIRTALANFVESDFGCTSRIYFDNVMLMLHSVTLTPHK